MKSNLTAITMDSKMVCLYEVTKSVDSQFCPDIDELEEYILQPFKIPNRWARVTIPAELQFRFFAKDVIQALNCMVRDEIISKDAGKAIADSIRDSEAEEIFVRYEFDHNPTVNVRAEMKGFTD